MRLVDIHTHIFNARHVPIRSFLAGRFHLPPPLPQVLEKIFNALTDARPPADLEDDHVLSLLAPPDLGTPTVESLADQWAALLLPGRDSTSREAILELDRFITKHTDLMGMGLGLLADHDLLHGWLRKALQKLLTTLGEALEGQGVAHVTRFLSYLLEDEHVLAHRLAAEYDGLGWTTRRFGIHMMDMEQGCEEAPRLPYPVQVQRMEAIHRLHGDDALLFVAYDPRRPGALDLVKEAILERHFTGVKLYPPMGYQPSGNAGAGLDDAMEALFDWAEPLGVPFMVHCTPTGAEARKGLGWHSHPRHWVQPLQRHPDLVVCLGHGGGGDQTSMDRHSAGWCPATEAEWQAEDNMARWAVELCTSFPGVHCDLSAHGYLIAEQELSGAPCQKAHLERMRFEARFALEMARPAPATSLHRPGHPAFPFASKVMYGSDWHMPGQVGLSARYLGYFWDLFDRLGLPRDGFFHAHAEAFLSAHAALAAK